MNNYSLSILHYQFSPFSLKITHMDLILFGIQGSGKGTQAKKLAAEFGYDIFEAGGELRKIAALARRSGIDAKKRSSREDGSGSELGKTVKSFIDQGELVPFEIIMKVLEEAVKARPHDQKILFDGIPRDLDQKNSFDEIMNRLGRDFHCIQITLDPEEGVQRILKRAEIEGRADDASEETIRKRMGTFLEKTMPVIQGYEKAGKVTHVDGQGSVEEIYERVTTAVQSN
jgi:adenylate kinase